MSALSDPIADLLTRIRNACMASLPEVLAPYSRIKAEIARVLQEEGYIWSYEVDSTGEHPQLKVKLKYDKRQPVIRGLKRISRPGLRTYVGATAIPRVLGGLGISILSTPKGIVSGRVAKSQNVGGELLATVW
jgi:small subunit ribosomal protein S8